MTFRDNPLVAIDVHNVFRCQFLHVDERQGGKTDKDEDVTNKCKISIFKFMHNDGFQFILRQEFSFFAVGADVELCERVTRNLAIIVRSQNYTFQPHTALPDGSVCQTSVSAEIGGELLDKVGS